MKEAEEVIAYRLPYTKKLVSYEPSQFHIAQDLIEWLPELPKRTNAAHRWLDGVSPLGYVLRYHTKEVYELLHEIYGDTK